MCVLQENLLKVAVHTSDLLWHKILIWTRSHASFNTGCIVSLFNPIKLGSIATYCGGQ